MVELIAKMGDDVQIEHMARISNPAASVTAGSGKLLDYLIKHKHWSATKPSLSSLTSLFL